MKKLLSLSFLVLFSVCTVVNARDAYAPSRHVNTSSTIRQRHSDAAVRYEKNQKAYAAAAKINYNYKFDDGIDPRSNFYQAKKRRQTLENNF